MDPFKNGCLNEEEKSCLLSFFDKKGNLIAEQDLIKFIDVVKMKYPVKIDESGRFRCVICGNLNKSMDICESCKNDFFKKKKLRKITGKFSGTTHNNKNKTQICGDCKRPVNKLIKGVCWNCYRKKRIYSGTKRLSTVSEKIQKIRADTNFTEDVFERFNYGFFSSDSPPRPHKPRTINLDSGVLEKHRYGFFSDETESQIETIIKDVENRLKEVPNMTSEKIQKLAEFLSELEK